MEPEADLVPGLDPVPARVDIDLDAIRARYERAQYATRDDYTGATATALVLTLGSADDVPALLARLAEVEAERDAAREAAFKLANQPPMIIGTEPKIVVDYSPEALAQHRAEASRHMEVLADRDNLAAENARLRQDAERLARRLAGRYEETVGLRAQIEWMLPVVEAAERAGEPTYPLEQVRDEVMAADPPGLDAAIDAARPAYNRNTYGEVAAEHDEGLIAAVRAAAPALRAGALREAADEVDGRFPTPWTVEFAAWLRDRADRIGGAT